MQMIRNLFLILTLVFSGWAFAQTPLTLQQAVVIGLEKNPIRKAALAQQKVTRADVREARAAFSPQISFSEGATRGNDPVYVFGTKLRQARFSAGDFALNLLNTPPPVNNFSTRFSGRWTLFDSFANSLNLRRARQMNDIASAQLDQSDQELLFRIVDAYYGLLLARKQAELASQTLKTAEAVYDSSKVKYDSGLAVESDLLAAQVTVATRRQESITAQNAVALAGASLGLAMGMPSGTVYEPAEMLAERTLPSRVLDDSVASALRLRPELKQMQLQVEAQQTGVRIAKSAFGPRVNVFGGWELDNRSFAANGSNNWMAGAEIQIDLFSGGQKVAHLDREKAMLERVNALKQAASDRVRLEVQKAYYDHDTARQTIEVARASVAQAEESLRIVQTRYEGGLTPIAELLRAEDAARLARTNYWQSVYRYQTSYAALELATGELNSQSPVVTQ